MKTKGQRKAEDRRHQRHREKLTTGITKMLGRLTRFCWGSGVKVRERDDDGE
jgi:hypothetical protein